MYDDDKSREGLLNAYSSEVCSALLLRGTGYILYIPFQAVFSLSVVISERLK